MSVQDDRVIFVRELPFGDVEGVYRSSITMANGEICQMPEWLHAHYPDRRATGNVSVYEIGDWAKPCVDEGPPFYMQVTRWIKLWGWLPLRPMTTSTDVIGESDAVINSFEENSDF